MVDIKCTKLASGKMRVTVKVYRVGTSRNTRIGIGASLKPRINFGAKKQTKTLIMNESVLLENPPSLRQLRIFADIYNLSEGVFMEILRTVKNQCLLYGLNFQEESEQLESKACNQQCPNCCGNQKLQ